MDVLTDVLEAVHLKSLFYGRLELTAPWGLRMDGGRPGFYVVTRGTCWLEVENVEEPVQLAGGDFFLLLRGQAHAVKDSRETSTLPVADVLGKCSGGGKGCQPGGVRHYGGGGALTTLVGGFFLFEEGEKNPLLSSLPPVIHVKGDRGTTVQWLEANLQFVASEMASGQPGALTVVSRLADILFVQAVRAHLAQSGEGAKGWLRALVDPQIGEALGLIHEKPEEPWTVESLASRVAMSRSAFAARFAHLVEEPPLTYLTRWRMQRATRLLRTGQASVGEIARRVGYDAEAAFSKAFKRSIGVAPGAYRRTRAQATPRAVS
ncbi:MAG: AraC family transcriptional regulator [Thermoanaerobaculia bacterium]